VIEISEFERPTDLGNDIVRARAIRAKVKKSRQFLARVHGSEAGYLSYDDRSDIKTGVLYEVFVLPEFRQQGVGSRLVAFAEQLAVSLKCSRMRLSPTPFDQSVTQVQLNSWYKKKGYERALDGSGEFEKTFD
jgi:GNAT superfamily N-acetyltransferase